MPITAEQKIERARTLLIEATREIRQRGKVETAAHLCRCGHRRDEHTVSTSVNYTEGFCMTPSCRCQWFLMADGQPMETRR